MIGTVFLLAFIGILTYFLYYRWKNNEMHVLAEQFEGPPTLPFIGNLHYLIGKRSEGEFIYFFFFSFFILKTREKNVLQTCFFLYNKHVVNIKLQYAFGLDRCYWFILLNPWMFRGYLHLTIVWIKCTFTSFSDGRVGCYQLVVRFVVILTIIEMEKCTYKQLDQCLMADTLLLNDAPSTYLSLPLSNH